jgi:hypothetical protein
MDPDELLLLDDALEDEPEDDILSMAEIRYELAHQHEDDELGLRSLLERPEQGLPHRLSRVSASVLRQMYSNTSDGHGDAASAA